jgi:hypothetical protein
MARTRFRTKLASSRHVLAGATADDRRPAKPGDAPPSPSQPPGGRWSLTTYPAVSDEEVDGDA